jgi:hypothetical protein
MMIPGWAFLLLVGGGLVAAARFGWFDREPTQEELPADTKRGPNWGAIGSVGAALGTAATVVIGWIRNNKQNG